jgi:hypothetical protein
LTRVEFGGCRADLRRACLEALIDVVRGQFVGVIEGLRAQNKRIEVDLPLTRVRLQKVVPLGGFRKEDAEALLCLSSSFPTARVAAAADSAYLSDSASSIRNSARALGARKWAMPDITSAKASMSPLCKMHR